MAMDNKSDDIVNGIWRPANLIKCKLLSENTDYYFVQQL